MNNELATQQLTPQQKSWLTMPVLKNKLVEDLTRLSLTCQEVLLRQLPTISEKELQLKDYRAAHKAINEARLSSDFIKRINQVQDELMQFEKEADPKNNARYARLEAELIELKQREARKTADANAKIQEAAQYKAHIQNQIEGMVSDFKIRALNEINAMYGQAVGTGDKGLLPELEKTIGMMQFKQPLTFSRVRVTNEEAAQIRSQFTIPKVEDLRNQMIEESRRIFINLESDIAAGIMPDLSEQVQDIEAETLDNALITNLAAEVFVPEIKAEGKALKETFEIVVEETEAFALAIFVAWLKHGEAAKFLKVKKWSALTVGQMAIALGKLATEKGIKFQRLTLKAVTSL